MFLESIKQYLEGRPTEVGEAVFDKEDDLAVEFVTAAANLRAANYNIAQQSLFVTKVCSGGLFFAHAHSLIGKASIQMILSSGTRHDRAWLLCRAWQATSYMPSLPQTLLREASLWWRP